MTLLYHLHTIQMKIKFYAIFFLWFSQSLSAQVPEEALRLSWTTQTGTARNQAIGGAMGSLGGDATAGYVNPAGLAFFKTSDFVLSPGWKWGKSPTDFRGNVSKGTNIGSVQLGTSGFVFGGFGHQSRNSFSITVNRVANFNQSIRYNGQNDYSSFAEPLADEFAASNLTINEALNANNISLTTRMALYTYLVDTATINGSKQVIARSEFPALLNQEHETKASGGITEINFAMAHELDKKFMAGLSVGIPIIKIDRETYYRESDATGNGDNDFAYLSYRENYKLTGAGVNFRIGGIYRPKEYIRLGLALHSPNILMVKETFDAGFAADLENLFAPNSGYDTVASSTFTSGPLPAAKCSLYTPGKIILSGSYVFREVENINRQKGFLTADIEYVNYKWNKFGPSEEVTDESKLPYEPYNDAIDLTYKGTFNFRVGGELKFKILMARLGFAYYGSPYKDKELKARKMNLSGGLGYRHKGIFIDLAYVHRLDRDVNFPYRVNSPRANTFATLKDNGGTALLTVGFKI
jgi:hypothetical protein